MRDLLALLIDVDNCGLLLGDEHIHILVQLCELDHLSLDLRDGFVTVADLTKDRLRLSATISLKKLELDTDVVSTQLQIEEAGDVRGRSSTYRLAKDLLVGRVLDRFTDLGIGGIGSNNSVLTLLLHLELLSEIPLDRLILVNDSLQSPVDLSKLWSILGASRIWLRFEGSDTVGQVAVKGHGISPEPVQLLVCRAFWADVGVIEGPLLEELQLAEVLLDRVNTLIHLTTSI